MENIVLWFQPLLWILGTITTLGCFIRFCKPVWNFLQLPKKIMEDMGKLDAKISNHLSEMEGRLNSFDEAFLELKEFDRLSKASHKSLLRDRLHQGYHFYYERGYIPSGAYRALCETHEIYHKYDGNSYTDTVMEKIHDLFRNPRVRPPSDETVPGGIT